MELILNLAWVLVAASVLACWPLMRSRAKGRSGRQLLALSLLLFILFPAISITDDLWAAHNPAETDVLLRRSDDARHHHCIPPRDSPGFLISDYQTPGTLTLDDTVIELHKVPWRKAPAHSSLFIRPPPVL